MSLLGGNSTFRGVIVADATALAAYIRQEQYQELELSTAACIIKGAKQY